MHRDLKSLHVLLLDARGQAARARAKLADFGFCEIKNSADSKARTVAGTPLWNAPELMSQEPHDAQAADVYSLGMVLYELAERRMPFAELSQMQRMRALLRGERPPLGRSVAAAWRALVAECWAQDPARRPTSATVAARAAALGPLKNPQTVADAAAASVLASATAVAAPAPSAVASNDRNPLPPVPPTPLAVPKGMCVFATMIFVVSRCGF